MTDQDSNKDTKGDSNDGGMQDGAGTQEKGIKSRLTEAQKEMLASKSRGGVSSQSVGHGHKPTHASGKQGPAEKKVRW